MCLPCEAVDAPDAVKTVWKLVDEYTLMEAERAMLKLMRGLDKHFKHVKQATATAGPDSTPGPLTTAGAAQPEVMGRLSPTALDPEEEAVTAALQQTADAEQNDMQRSQSSTQPGLQGAASTFNGQDPQAPAYANAQSPPHHHQQQHDTGLSSQYSDAGPAPWQASHGGRAAREGLRAEQGSSDQQLATVISQQQPAWPSHSQHHLQADSAGDNADNDVTRQAGADTQMMLSVLGSVQRPPTGMQGSRHAAPGLLSQPQHQIQAGSNHQSGQRPSRSIPGSRQVTQDILSQHSGSQHELHVGSNRLSGQRSPGSIPRSRQVTQDILGSRQVTQDFTGSRQVTRDIPGSRQVTQDIPSRHSISMQGAAGESAAVVRKSASRKRDKLEYRLSQDDVYNPTAAEVQALLHSSVCNSSQHSGQLPSSNFAAMNGSIAGSGLSSALAMSAARGYAVSSMFTNPLGTHLGLEKGQEGLPFQAEDVSMLPLIHRVQAVQVIMLTVTAIMIHALHSMAQAVEVVMCHKDLPIMHFKWQQMPNAVDVTFCLFGSTLSTVFLGTYRARFAFAQ